MKKYLLIFLLAIQSAWAFNLQDRTAGQLTFEWDQLQDFEEAADLFMKSFLAAYDSVSIEQLGVENKEDFLREAIKEELVLVFENEDIHWLIAKERGQVVGLLIMELTHYPAVVYGRQMAIDPNYMRSSIGTQMAFTVQLTLPEVEKFVAITRIFNERSMSFFESLGFKRCDYMHEGYDPKKYVGFELSFTEG